MDMDFKSPKKQQDTSTTPKNLPGFRGSSEIPEHTKAAQPTETKDEIPASLDPTDLTLEREKSVEDPVSTAANPTPKKERRKTSKKEKIILIVILLLVIIGAVAMLVVPKILNKEEPVVIEAQSSQPVKDEAPTQAPSPLSGLDISPELASRPVTAIMIENSVEARPQSGLVDAELVFEAIAEGGITRFVALFQANQPEKIGPIRSARPYYVDLAKTFDAAYVHAGGSPDALSRISELGIKDMSAFESNGTYYRADDRDAPHDLYTSMPQLDVRRTQLGFTNSTYESWKRKNDTPQTTVARAVDITISSPQYNTSYTHDPVTNTYLRSLGGEPHVDQSTSAQIAPKVVVALITSRGQDGIYSDYRLTGSGEIRVFQDGIMSTGTWSKESANSQFVFKDKNGLDFYFNKGQTWVTIVDSASDVNYAE